MGMRHSFQFYIKSINFRFIGIFDLIFIALVALSLGFCSKSPGIVKPTPIYKANLEDGFDFSREGNPQFIKKISGLAGREDWGRWSEQNVVTIDLSSPLPPKKYTLEIQAKGFGPNTDSDTQVIVGSVVSKIRLSESANTFSIPIEIKTPIYRIEIVPPKPSSPHDLYPSNTDSRKLGVGLKSLRIY